MEFFRLENGPSSIPVVQNGYETVGVVQLYSSDFLANSNRVVTVAPTPKSTKLHPLEIEVQKSLEAKRQNQLARLASSSSVIQALPNPCHSATPAPTIQSLDTTLGPSSQVTLHHSLELHQSKPSTQSNMYDAPGDNTPRIVWRGDGNTLLYNDSEGVEDQPGEKEETMDLDSCQIPLTVQYCVETADVAIKTEDVDESNTDEERDTETPVYDHEPDPEPAESISCSKDMDANNRCFMCFKKFRQKKNMYAHIRKIHSSQPKIQGGIICPLCKMHCLRQEHLRAHLATLHGTKIIKEERQFATIQEFHDWKSYIEKETVSFFISKSATKLLAYNQTKSYYKCHRSGCSSSDKIGSPKKAQKKQSTCKIGATCPAAMEVTENVEGVTVTFWATHVGHNLSSKNDSSRVQELLSVETPQDEVLDETKRDSEELLRQPPSKEKRPEEAKYVVLDKKMISLGRKPKAVRLAARTSQHLLIDKAERFVRILETTELIPAFRPMISAMLDNIISLAERRSVSNMRDRENASKKRSRELTNFDEECSDESSISLSAVNQKRKKRNYKHGGAPDRLTRLSSAKLAASH